jgi:hypothetical protein
MFTVYTTTEWFAVAYIGYYQLRSTTLGTPDANHYVYAIEYSKFAILPVGRGVILKYQL